MNRTRSIGSLQVCISLDDELRTVDQLFLNLQGRGIKYLLRRHLTGDEFLSVGAKVLGLRIIPTPIAPVVRDLRHSANIDTPEILTTQCVNTLANQMLGEGWLVRGQQRVDALRIDLIRTK